MDSTEKPLLLIPQTEVELLFKDINQGLNLGVGFPDVYREPGFRLDFIEEGSPLPRFLGRLSSDCIMAELEVLIPAQGSALEEPENVDDRTLPAFRQKMQGALLASKQKNKAAQDKRRMERIKTRKGLFAELKRSQCYLGLRPRGINQPTNFVANPNLTFEETQQAQEAYELAAGIRLPLLNFSAKAPHQFDRNVVFVCIDIEVYERDSNKLTEIGVCTLDTLDLVNIAPGEVGKKWMEKLRYRHFRIAEYAHLTNKDFVDGCADRFEFGTSEWISIKDAPRVIASCFKAPFSEPGKYTPHPAEARQLHAAGSRKHTQVNESPSHNRNVVLVGHSIKSDIDFMRKVGYDVGNLSNLVEAIDTSNLFRAFKHEQNPRNLGSVLLDFELTGWNLHNAVSRICHLLSVEEDCASTFLDQLIFLVPTNWRCREMMHATRCRLSLPSPSRQYLLTTSRLCQHPNNSTRQQLTQQRKLKPVSKKTWKNGKLPKKKALTEAIRSRSYQQLKPLQIKSLNVV